MAAALVQEASNQASAVSSIVVTLPAAATSGNRVLIALALTDPDAGTLDIAITGLTGGSWVTATDEFNGFGRLVLGYKLAATAGTQVTFSFTRSGPPAAVGAVAARVAEFSGVSAVLSQPDTTAEGEGAYSEDPFVLISTAYPSDLLWVAFRTPEMVTPASTPAGWSDLGALSVDGGGSGLDLTMDVAWREQTIAGYGLPANTATWVVDGNTQGWNAHGLALKLIGPASALAGSAGGAGDAQAMLTAVHSSTIPASPIALPERWLIRRPGDSEWTDLSNWAYLVTRVASADAHPALRGEDAPHTSREGRQALGKLADGRTVPLAIYVQPANAAGALIEASERRQARVNLDALQTILALRSQFEMMRVMPNGDGRVAAVEVTGVQPIEEQMTGVVFGLMVDFFLADPWFYGLNVTDSRTISASPTEFTIAHPGSVSGDLLIIEALGTLTGLTITNKRTGHIIEYSPALTAAQRLIVNVRAATARVNGASVLDVFRHYGPAGDPAFFRLEPGDNPIEVAASVTGGTTTLVLRPPYV